MFLVMAGHSNISGLEVVVNVFEIMNGIENQI